MKNNTYIVVIPVNGGNRATLEDIENVTFQNTDEVRQYIHDVDKLPLDKIEVWPITDFMDEINNSQYDSTTEIWFGYVLIKKEEPKQAINYTVVFNVKRYDNVPHYQGIIFEDGSMKLQFGQTPGDYSDFINWCNEQCKQFANGQEFRMVDLTINHEQFKEAYCYG